MKFNFATVVLSTILALVTAAPVHSVPNTLPSDYIYAAAAANHPLSLMTPANDPHTLQTRNVDGVVTYYFQNGRAGSCQKWHADTDYIAAIGEMYWPVNSHGVINRSNCGRVIWIKAKNGQGAGHITLATVMDTCPECPWNHVDLSLAPFSVLAQGSGFDIGKIRVEWGWMKEGFAINSVLEKSRATKETGRKGLHVKLGGLLDLGIGGNNE